MLKSTTFQYANIWLKTKFSHLLPSAAFPLMQPTKWSHDVYKKPI